MRGVLTAVEAPDIVVPVRQGAFNEQLRYALRSWEANLPHRRVWVLGHRPQWLTGVEYLPVPQRGTKYQNTTASVRRACEHPDITSTFLLCNDDFFVMAPQPGGMPVLHRGPVAEVERYYAARASGKYLRGMRETAALLAELGHPDPLSYELHVPIPVDRAGMLAALDKAAHLDVVHKRTLYGVLSGLEGQQIEDVKVLHRGARFDVTSPYLSTMPETFRSGVVGAHIRRAFPRPGRYERGGRPVPRAAAHRAL